MHRVATHPRTRQVGPGAVQHHAEPQRALAARLDLAVGGLAEDRDVTVEQLGALLEQLQEPAVRRRDLLAGVEHVGDVDRGGRVTAGELEHHGEPGLHVGGADTPQHVALDARRRVVVRRHRVGVTGEHDPRGSAQGRARDHVVAHPIDRQVREGTQLRLDRIHQRPLGEALRGDGDQLGGARQQVRRHHDQGCGGGGGVDGPAGGGGGVDGPWGGGPWGGGGPDGPGMPPGGGACPGAPWPGGGGPPGWP